MNAEHHEPYHDPDLPSFDVCLFATTTAEDEGYYENETEWQEIQDSYNRWRLVTFYRGLYTWLREERGSAPAHDYFECLRDSPSE